MLREREIDIAIDLNGHTLGARGNELFSAIVSGIPLLNFPMARRRIYMEGVCRLLQPGEAEIVGQQVRAVLMHPQP